MVKASVNKIYTNEYTSKGKLVSFVNDTLFSGTKFYECEIRRCTATYFFKFEPCTDSKLTIKKGFESVIQVYTSSSQFSHPQIHKILSLGLV